MTLSELNAHLVCALTIFIVGYLGVLAAYFFRDLEFFSVLNVFSGGLMFSAGLIHLLPDAAESLEDDYPWAFFCCSSSFLLLFLLEKFLHQHYHAYHEVKTPPVYTFEDSKVSPWGSKSEVAHTPRKLTMNDVDDEAGYQHSHGHSHLPDDFHEGVFGCITFFIGLSAHSFLEGLGLGSQNGTDIWAMFVAIMAHKGLAGFALGASFVRAGLSPCLINLWGLMFAIITPACVMFGYLMDTAEDTQIDGVMLALASGSFLYVAIIEVLAQEFLTDVTLTKVLSCLTGWMVMALLAFWV